MSTSSTSSAVPSLGGALFIDELFRTLKAVQLHSVVHPQARAACARFVELVTPRLPMSLAFVAGGAFVDFVLIALELETWERLNIVVAPLHLFEVDELTLRIGLSADEVLAFGAAWAEGARGNRHALDDLGQLAGIGFRALAGTSRGVTEEVVDRDVALVAEAALAVADTERLLASPRDSWTLQTTAIRRLERAFGHPHPALVAFEQSRPTVARRAVNAALVAGALLQHVGASSASTRAASHAALVVGCCGLRERGGLTVAAARPAAVDLALAAPLARSGVEPHRLRVCSLVLAGDEREPHAATGAVFLAYELERMRCPEHVPFDLTNADLWAALAAKAGVEFSLHWVRVLVDRFGAIPAGAWIELADGRRALVLGPSDQPSRPLVMIDGTTVTPVGPLRLLSAAEVR